ncbi:MAG: hypothetical protein RLZZ630_649 [Bacteroidota bacterium]|jgi:hypothetical protein
MAPETVWHKQIQPIAKIFILFLTLAITGCIVGERQSRPAYWPPLVQARTQSRWDERIPFQSLKQLSMISESNDLLTYRNKGYTPRLVVTGSSRGLFLVNDLNADTVVIWNMVQKKGFRWDTKLRKMKIRIHDSHLTLLPKTIYEVKGGDPLVGFKRESIRIYIDTEGGLQIQKRFNAYGLIFMLFPTYLRDREWFIYEKDTSISVETNTIILPSPDRHL